MKIRSIRKREIDGDKDKDNGECPYGERIAEHRKTCLKNNSDFIDKMVDDELREVKTYKIFETDYFYENPFKIDESTSISDDLKIITGK